MSLATMSRRMEYLGGANPHDQMIENKRWTFQRALTNTYQAAQVSKVNQLNQGLEVEDEVFTAVINPIRNTETYDNKMFSTNSINEFTTGTVFNWRDRDNCWIIYLGELDELSHFRGICRRCDHVISWVDGYKQVKQTYAAVIGPQAEQLVNRTTGDVVTDIPNRILQILVPDNEINNTFFGRYQKFMIKGYAYEIEEVDDISMPGILKIRAMENYANQITDDVENSLVNAWNISPVLVQEQSSTYITGPTFIRPHMTVQYTVAATGGSWYIEENNTSNAKTLIPFETVDFADGSFQLKYTGLVTLEFTLAYDFINGAGNRTVYRKKVRVEDLF